MPRLPDNNGPNLASPKQQLRQRRAYLVLADARSLANLFLGDRSLPYRRFHTLNRRQLLLQQGKDWGGELAQLFGERFSDRAA
jgi:hypothetical protein